MMTVVIFSIITVIIIIIIIIASADVELGAGLSLIESSQKPRQEELVLSHFSVEGVSFPYLPTTRWSNAGQALGA